MMLINSLLSHASDIWWDEFIDELERLNVRRAVVVCHGPIKHGAFIQCLHQRLMSLHTIEELTSCILDFQANIIRVTYRRKTTPVNPERHPSHLSALDFIWAKCKLQEEKDEYDDVLKWGQLGFDSEYVANEFADVGVLGLDCLVRIL